MLVFLNPIRCQLRTIATHYFFITTHGDSMMLRKLFCFSSIALLSGLPLSSALTTAAQAQTSSEITSPQVTITNISKLERRIGGGHRAKITYKVILPEKFSLKKVSGSITFKLLGGKTQTDTFSFDTSKREDTIEVQARGEAFSVDQQPDKITAVLKATAEKIFNGTANASFRANGALISESNAFDLNVKIPKISDFKRQLAGGHKLRVHYQIPSVPSGFSAKTLLVRAALKLDDGKIQNDAVSRDKNIDLNGSEQINTNGDLVKRDGEVILIDTEVIVKGIITKSSADGNLTEQCIGTADCIN
jgi:hypothetical protein